MISILIPVYNFDVRSLISSLSNQGKSAEIKIEILCYDDGSSPEFLNYNKNLEQNDYVVYKKIDKNIGRSRIRNMLANNAQFDILLFLDCDMHIVKNDFLELYAKSFEKDDVVVGGIVYDQNEPEDKLKLLRWKFGNEREALSANIRASRPYRSFMSGNFMIDKNVFMDIGFDESITEYGHEDTVFGKELRLRNIKVKHIKNPIQHNGLEDASVFIEKTKKAIKNLAYLVNTDKLDSDVKLIRVYKTLRRFFLIGLMESLFDQNNLKWMNNLKSDNPNLRNLDLFKLGYLIKCLNAKTI